jgi:hypothetical protein
MSQHLPRRDFLKIGGTICGLSLVDLLRLEAQGEIAPRDAGKSVISIFLCGGQSHLDTFDMKPENTEIGGEFKPIATNNPELQVCEHMPRLAAQADKYLVLRSVSHTQAVHGPGQRYMRTGNRPQPALDYPEQGTIVSKELPSPRGVPPFVSLPVAPSNGIIESAGYLGVAYKSFSIQGDPNASTFSVRALVPPAGISQQRIARRIAFMNRIDRGLRTTDPGSQDLEGMDRFYEKAVDVLNSREMREACELSREDDKVRDAFGRHPFGQACLLARRLVEAGVRFVGIDFGGWDTHEQNFTQLKDRLLPPWDEGLATLLTDLHDRGLLDKTLVWSTGEFGRTPKINGNSGRDHWARATSMLLAGGGIAGGRVIGQTDKDGNEPTSKKYSPDDVSATIYRLLGLNHHKEYHTPDGRPVLLVRDGTPIGEVM